MCVWSKSHAWFHLPHLGFVLHSSLEACQLDSFQMKWNQRCLPAAHLIYLNCWWEFSPDIWARASSLLLSLQACTEWTLVLSISSFTLQVHWCHSSLLTTADRGKATLCNPQHILQKTGESHILCVTSTGYSSTVVTAKQDHSYCTGDISPRKASNNIRTANTMFSGMKVTKYMSDRTQCSAWSRKELENGDAPQPVWIFV